MLFRLGVKERRSEFYNFERELEAVKRELVSAQTRMVVIRGVRRTGKSSLLRVALAELSLPYLLVDARAAEAASMDAFSGLLSLSLARLMEEHKPVERLLRRVRGISVMGFEVAFRSRSVTTLSAVFAELDGWARREGKPLVLALDEAQHLRQLPGFRRLLAHVYDYLSGVKLLLAGSEVGLLDRLLGVKDPASPLYGRPSVEVGMRGLPEDKACDFLRRGFTELGHRQEEREILEAVRRLDGIIGWLTNYGYYAARIGHGEALRRTLEEGARLVRGELEAFLALRQQARKRYVSLLRAASLPSRWGELKGELERAVGSAVSDKQFSRYLKELVDYGFLTKENELYRHSDPLISYACVGL